MNSNTLMKIFAILLLNIFIIELFSIIMVYGLGFTYPKYRIDLFIDKHFLALMISIKTGFCRGIMILY